MSPELEKQLYDKYPKIFVEKDKSIQESCMAFGIETPDDWYDIIDTLCHALTYTYSTVMSIDVEDGLKLGLEPLDKYYKDGKDYVYRVECPQVVTEQVKEKYGTLRFYYRLDYNNDINYLLETKKYPQLETILNKFHSYVDGIVHYAEVASERKNEQKINSYYN